MMCNRPFLRSMTIFFCLIFSLSIYSQELLAQTEKSNRIPGRIMVKFKYDEVELPRGQVEADLGRVNIRSAELKQALLRFQITRFAKVVHDAVKGDTLRTLPDGRQVKLADLSQLFLLKFPESVPIDSVLTLLQKSKQVIYVEPDQYNISNEEPDDQFFDDQWHLQQEGGQYDDEDIDAPEAWDLSKGEGVKIAIIDQGVRRTHEDFAGKIIGGDTGVDPGNPNHGTRVAGVAAAATDNDHNNNKGIAGVGWKSKIIPYNDNRQLSQSIADINAAVSAGADIINMSWHNSFYSQSFKDALLNAFAQGVTLVAAAGNLDVPDDPPFVAYPQAFDGLVTAVSATNKSGSFNSLSNSGYFVDVAAPGQSIKTTDGDHDADYVSPTGTSYSAPIVSGIAALLRAFEPQLEDRDIERII